VRRANALAACASRLSSASLIALEKPHAGTSSRSCRRRHAGRISARPSVRQFEHEFDDGRHCYPCVRASTELPYGAQRLEQWIVDTLTKKYGGRAAA
jgi:hypothetical protein